MANKIMIGKQWAALDMRVIVVAVQGEVDDWSAYIGAVTGDNHNEEWEKVSERGAKLPKEVAYALIDAGFLSPTWRKLNWRY